VADENPALGRYYIQSFDAADENYPIVAVHWMPYQGMPPVPTLYSACPVAQSLLQLNESFPWQNLVFVEDHHYASDQRTAWLYRILPGPWLYDFSVQKEILTFIFSQRRIVRANTVNPSIVAQQGSGATAVATESGGGITGITISGGTGYANYFGISVAAPSVGVTAQAYGTAVNGVPNPNAIMVNAGSGYSGAPVVTVLPGCLIETMEKDIPENDALQWEIITMMPDSAFVRSWNDVMDWSFPGVLDYFNISGVLDNAGYLYKVCLNYNILGPYHGPVPVVITESWTVAPPAVDLPTILLPTAMNWDFVTTSGHIQECLHGAIHIEEAGGGDSLPQDPAPYYNTIIFAATNYTSIPNPMTLIVHTVPYEGGYKKTKIVADTSVIPGP
jgi:hypothetical protein